MTDAARQARHDLRTPVNHILSYARLVLEDAEELGLDEDVEVRLDTIQAAGHQALALIDALLERGGSPERLALRSLAGGIADQSERLRAMVADAGHTQAAADVGRIVEAAHRLQTLVGEPASQPSLREEGQQHRPDEESSGRDDEAGRLGVGPDGIVSRKPAPTPVVGDASTSVPGGLNADPDSIPQPLFHLPSQGDGASPSTLLVVDDNEANRDVLSRSLTRLGYDVLQAEDGRVALDVLAHAEVDLVLLDIMMPVLDGYAVLERRRGSSRLRSIPFIVISATGDDASVIRCIEMGAEDYLPKPFDPVLLRARIGACLEKKRLHDQEQRHLATIEAQAAALAEWNQTLERRVAEQVTRLERLSGLKRFLPSQLAETIADTGDTSLLKSHRRQIAVVFCDLRGFTPFSEVAEPEEVMDVLNEYHTTMGVLIARYAGTVEHFAGDGLMVLFNDPLPCPEPELQAVRMAVEMREQMAKLTAAWRKRGHLLGFGVGITHGYATLGQIGFEGRLHYAAIGSVVNLAARLCGEAKDGQILASRRVGLVVDGAAEVHPIGDLTLKGFRDPVPAVEIVRLAT